MNDAPNLGSNRRVPNEVSALIIDGLHDDLHSLRNVALVCRDFTYLARAHIFRKVDLTAAHYHGTDYPLVGRFATLLRDPHDTPSIEDVIQTLHVSAHLDSDDTAFILHRLPYLTEIRIKFPTSTHLQIIETNLGTRLRELWIDGPPLHHQEDHQLFQRMLTSLATLNILVMDHIAWDANMVSSDIFILPKSLEFVSLHAVTNDLLCAIGKGLKLRPIMLRAIFLQLTKSLRGVDGSSAELWAGIGLHTPVVLNVGGYILNGVMQVFNNRMDGLNITQLVFSCTDAWPLYLVRLIPIIPESVRRICIDIDTLSYERFHNSPLWTNIWPSLDAALCRRHDKGWLELVCFRCTIRARPFDFLTPHEKASFNRSTLKHIERMLPESTKLGFIDVDHAMMFFEPTM